MRMPEPFLLRDWQGFFQLAGTAAATLIGLIFLAISLGARLVPAEDNTALRAFVVPIVIHFGAVLVLSALMLIPAYTPPLLGLTLIAAGLVGLGYDLGVLESRNDFLPVLALAALALIIVGLRNAFDLFLWIARQPV
jgi:hypothetical protein